MVDAERKAMPSPHLGVGWLLAAPGPPPARLGRGGRLGRGFIETTTPQRGAALSHLKFATR